MSLNIKNPEARHLIEELAEATGETMTAAVTIAVRERLERIRRRGGISLADTIMAIGRDSARRISPEYRALDHDAVLYDENGLPR
jgi:antitoxin VapB